MRCYECGYQNESDVKVCIKCGTKLEEGSVSSPPPPPKPAQDAPSGGAKTMRGQAASAPSWDSPKTPSTSNDSTPKSSSIIKCPSCSFYPLPAVPSKSSPCPNCGFGAASGESNTGSKTVRVASISLGDEDESKKSFKLIDERSGKEISFEGSTVDVNRDSVDPDNNTISSSVHASFSFENGQLNIEDKSSNGSTFIKVDGKMPVEDGSKIVIGNKVFTLKIN
ncbi:MAG: hypothetical protein JXQ87_06020 [Bacteroidia bacterium]